MKSSRATIVASLTLAIGLTGCGDILSIDNFDAPNALLEGRVVHDGQPVGVRNGTVELELWEPGFDLEEKIPVHIAQDGSFSASLFDGDYEINLRPGNGPWVDDPNRIPVQVRGNTALDIQVTPYYTVQNESIANVGGTIEATFGVGEIDTSRDLAEVGLFVGTTHFVDQSNEIVNVRLDAGDIADPSSIDLSVDLPEGIELAPGPDPRSRVYVRIGVRTDGISEWLFSQLHEVDL